MESQRPLADFAVLAFTLSYEFDYFNMVQTLRSAGIPLYAERARRASPAGDRGRRVHAHEPRRRRAVPRRGGHRRGRGDHPVPRRGVAGRPVRLARRAPRRAGAHPRRVRADAPPDRAPSSASGCTTSRSTEAYSTVLTEDTELSNMTLIEVARGCGRGCRFCIAGYVFRPPRYRPAKEQLLAHRRALARSTRRAWGSSARPSPTTRSCRSSVDRRARAGRARLDLLDARRQPRPARAGARSPPAARRR